MRLRSTKKHTKESKEGAFSVTTHNTMWLTVPLLVYDEEMEDRG